jgi:hypothetical protein
MHDQLALNLDARMPASGTAVPSCATEAEAPAPMPTRIVLGKPPVSRLLQLTPPAGAQRPTTLRGCVVWLGGQLGPGAPEVKLAAGAVRTLIKVVHKLSNPSNEDLPADPVLLRPHLRDALPAAIGLSRSRFDNAKSLLVSLLVATGWVSPHTRSGEALQPVWQGMLNSLPRQEIASPLRRFFRFCDRAGIEPAMVSSATVETYEAWLATETLEFLPRHAAIAVTTAWRRAQHLCPLWPRQELRLPSKVWQKALLQSAFPSSFQVDLEAYLAALRAPDPLDPTQGRPLA